MSITTKNRIIADELTAEPETEWTPKSPSVYGKTPEQRREAMEIARDCLLQIEARKLVAAHGVVMRFEGVPESKPGDDARAFVQSVDTCHVCAKGALFLGALEKRGGILLEDPHWETTNALEVFSRREIDLAEWAFEEWGRHYDFGKDDKISSLPKGNERLIAVMNRILEHEGEFVWESA